MSQSIPTSVTSGVRSRAAVPPASTGRLLGNWQLHQLVGQGTITSVYDARPLGCPPNWHADYVVKQLRPEFRRDRAAVAAMRREAEVGRLCSHPHLVPILESHVDADPPHIVMPKLQGATLDAVIKGVGRLIVPQALWLTRQIAQALRYLHGQGWLHGDVKPANIVVSRQGHATLIDLAFAMRPSESFYNPDRPMLGTLAYVAPELLTSTNATQPASDIYSLGITLYEMLSGRLPFQFTEPSRLVEAHLQDTPPDLQRLSLNIPQPVSELITRMLAKSTLRRPSSCDSLIDELTELEIETLESRFAK
jgi:serine/threonine-protein kinase